MTNLLKKIYRKIYGWTYTPLRYFFDRTPLKVYWWNGIHNFGDALNPAFIYMLTGKKISWINPRLYKRKNYIVMGSILVSANKYSIVWGAGFLFPDSKCSEKPFKVCAVRGPLTRQKLLENGIDCPEVYGDPALLLPLLYTPKIEKKYKLGIIPHFHDKTSEWLEVVNNSDVKIIDIQNSDPMRFIDELLSCEKIASSSLHGLIVADAYKIPSLWLEFSDKVEGEGFKFRDYFLSHGGKQGGPQTGLQFLQAF